MTLSERRQLEIREIARNIQNAIWRERHKIWRKDAPNSAEEMVPMKVKDIITRFYALTLEQPDHIPSESGVDSHAARLETAGLMDRTNKKIVISLNFPLEQRIFTAAHELGHYELHTGITYHHTRVLRRDRPQSGPDRSFKRDICELEADLFAAEFLMPRRILEREFVCRFRHPVDHAQVGEELGFHLVNRDNETSHGGTDREKLFSLAKSIARATCFDGHFVSLSDRFAVSPTAMAIQLIDLQLVH